MRPRLFPLLIALALLLPACTSAADGPPAAPSAPALATAIAPDAPGVLGLYSLHIGGDLSAPEVTLDPLANAAAIGDSYLLDASKYFRGALCSDCVRVSGIALVDATTLDLSVTIRHPFALPPPILGPNDRLDLHIFDVAGMLVSAEPGGLFFPATQTKFAPPRLLNPTGYSSTLDPLLDRIFPTPNADAHPYRMFAVDTTFGNFNDANPGGFADLRAPSGHNVLPQGGQASSTFRLRMPPPGVAIRFDQDLLFVVTASWGQGAANKTERQTPVYRLPEFNQKAAWEIRTAVQFNNFTAGNTASDAMLAVWISDWQWAAPQAATWPDPASKSTLRAASPPFFIFVEIPGVTNGAMAVNPAIFGTSGTTRLGQVALHNSLGAPAGSYAGLVQVRDQLVDAQGIAQDDSLPTGLGQLNTYQLFSIDVAPGMGSDTFDPAVFISDRTPQDAAGHYNSNMPDLVTDGTNLFLAYQGPAYEAVVARRAASGSSFMNIEVHQGSSGVFMDPSVGCTPGTGDMQLVLAAPDDSGMYSAPSTTSGSSWGGLLKVHDTGDSPDDSQAITTGAGSPFCVFGILQLDGVGSPEFVLTSASFNGSAWTARANISDLQFGGGSGLIRIDETPMVFRLSTTTLVCVFGSNQRPIFTLADDTISEPVAVRSLDNGQTWQDWTRLRALDGTRTFETLSSTIAGDTLYTIEVMEDGEARMFRSLDEGRNWTAIGLPYSLPVRNGLAEIVGRPDGTLAAIWALAEPGNAQLQCSLMPAGSGMWGTAQSCEDDPGNNFTVGASSGVFDATGRLHIAFTSDRGPLGVMRWMLVSQTP